MSNPAAGPEAGSGAPVPATAAVCGLYCEACSIYIGSHEDPTRLAAFASRMGWNVDDSYCDGCRAERRTPYCRACDLYTCAAERSVDFCVECADYPCEALKGFQHERPHRADLFDDLARIAAVGVDTWMAEAKRRYSCPTCGTVNSAYDLTCRTCGQDPPNEYVAAHGAAIREALSRR